MQQKCFFNACQRNISLSCDDNGDMTKIFSMLPFKHNDMMISCDADDDMTMMFSPLPFKHNNMMMHQTE